MQTAIDRFLRYLRVEKNPADLTLKSYREDLTALLEYLTDSAGRVPAPAEMTPVILRGYVARVQNNAKSRGGWCPRRLAAWRLPP